MSDENPGPKEAVYDREISPLMAKIIAIAKEHKINMLATFSLGFEVDPEHEQHGEPLQCTTFLLHAGEDNDDTRDKLTNALRALRPPAQLVAFTITQGVKP